MCLGSSAGSTHRSSQLPDDNESMEADYQRKSETDASANGQDIILPHPLDVLDRCVYRYKENAHSKPPSQAPNNKYVFFFDLEDTIYLAHTVKVRKYQFLANFLSKQMEITDNGEIRDLILRRKDKLKQMLEFKQVTFEEPYTFIQPDRTVTHIVSNMKASKWIFTNSSLY